MRVEVLRATLPFARGYGMEIGMTVDAVRAGYRVARVRARPLPPRHRPHPRAASLHRGRQLLDFVRAYLLAARAQGRSR